MQISDERQRAHFRMLEKLTVRTHRAKEEPVPLNKGHFHGGVSKAPLLRAKVQALRARGYSRIAIRDSLGISFPTVDKYLRAK